jgi:hypothetical protein
MASHGQRIARPTVFLFVPIALFVLAAAPVALAIDLMNTSERMSYRIVGAEDKTPAKWEGHFSCEKKAGGFEVSGKCYKCESGFHRNLLSTKCVAPAHEDLKPISKKASATGLIKTDCPKGYFLHRLSGSCYQCPAGYNRTANLEVDGDKACSKFVEAVWKESVVAKDKEGAEIVPGCPSGTFRNLLADQCYSCPSGFNRSLKPGIDLTKLNDACVGQYYRTLRPAQSEVYTPSADAKPSWTFSLYDEAGNCYGKAVKGGAGGDVQQTLCHLVTINVPVAGRAEFQERKVTTYSRDGKVQDVYCPVLQPPNETTGASFCKKTFASTEAGRIKLPGEL